MGYKKTYDLKKQAVIIGADADSFGLDKVESITATFDEDAVTKHVSANGDVRLVLNNNKSGSITLVLSASSTAGPKIELLRKSGIQFPIACADKTATVGTGYFLADGCMVQKVPDFVREKEEGTNDWTFICGTLEIVHASAADQ